MNLIKHPDGRLRCSWCGEGAALADYQRYHDQEWGVPVTDERRLFEKLCLEGFQSGLSWLTVLRKRERFRAVFCGFDWTQLADFTETDVLRLLADPGIIRHRGKVEATLNNARAIIRMHDSDQTLAKLVWSFEPKAADRPRHLTPEVAATLTQTDASRGLSKSLIKLGFKFVGPTTAYAFMQSMGIVNDHLEGCHSRESTEVARAHLARP